MSPELDLEAAAVDGNRHAGTYGRVGEVAYAGPEKPELGFRVNVLMQDLAALLGITGHVPDYSRNRAPDYCKSRSRKRFELFRSTRRKVCWPRARQFTKHTVLDGGINVHLLNRNFDLISACRFD